MAAVTHGVATASTTNDDTYSTSLTPAVGDLLVVAANLAQQLDDTAVLTDDRGGTYTQVAVVQRQSGAERFYILIRDQLVASAVLHTLTINTDPADPASGCIFLVARVSGMTKTGADAQLQFDVIENEGAGTPSFTFPGAVDTANPTIAFVFSSTNPPGLTEPVGWTERADVGHNNPPRGGTYCSRDSGFTGTGVAYGSATGSVYGAYILELDTSSSGPTLYEQAVPVTTTMSVGVNKSIRLTKPITTTASIALQKSISLTKPITSTLSVGFDKVLAITIAVAMSCAVLLHRKVSLTKAITSTLSVALNRLISLTKPFSSTFTVGLHRLIKLTKPITSTLSVGVLKAYVKDFNVNSTFVVGRQLFIKVTKAVSTTCNVGTQRTIRATKAIGSTFTVNVAKLLSKSFNIGSTFTVSVTAAKAFFVTITVATVMAVEFNRLALYSRLLEVSSTFNVNLQRYIKLTKNISSTFNAQVVELFAILQEFNISSTFTVVLDAVASLFDGFRGSLRRPKGRGKR